MTEVTTDVVSSSLPGWTLAEALARTSDPDHLIDSSDEYASTPQRTALWDRLSKGELVATGCFDAPTAPPAVIDRQDVPALTWSGSPSMPLIGVAGSNVQIFNVRVFPILRAPNAPDYLNGLSLSEAFRKYVINDPEVVALAKRLLKTDTRHSAVFLEGQVPSYFVDFHWPLDATASALAFRFVDSPLVILGDPLPTPSASISAVSEALADRIAALRNLLSGGKVVAFGEFSLTGVEGPLGRLQWLRGGISIDVRGGDLCDGPDHRVVAKWTGLGLRLPEATMPANQPHAVIATRVAEPPRKAKTQIVTKEKSRLDCIAWLEDMMSNPEIVPRSRDDLWAEAQSKWPNKLSQRDFLKARDTAITSKEAWNWKAPGPKPKSPHS